MQNREKFAKSFFESKKVKIISEEKICTEKPLEELWLQLRLFESEYYSRQFLKNKYIDITDKELNQLSVIFVSNIKQAYEYYYAASRVSILTSPLLYYYGMMCLTNVLWSSLNKTNEISDNHGLHSGSDSSDCLLSNEYVTVHQKGSFPALHSCFSEFHIEKSIKIYIKDILSVIPELKELFEQIYNEKSRCIKFNRKNHGCNYNSEIIHFQEILKNNINFFKQYKVGLVTQCNVDSGEKGIIDIQYSGIDDKTMFEYPVQKSLNGELFFTIPIGAENMVYGIPEASAHFMIMHCLGMLVRYEPVKWLQIVRGKLSSDINLINRFIEISKRKFPNMILNGLLGKELQFTMNNIDTEDSNYTLIY